MLLPYSSYPKKQDGAHPEIENRHYLVFNSEMRLIFHELGRTRIFAEAYMGVRSPPAPNGREENTAHENKTDISWTMLSASSDMQFENQFTRKKDVLRKKTYSKELIRVGGVW